MQACMLAPRKHGHRENLANSHRGCQALSSALWLACRLLLLHFAAADAPNLLGQGYNVIDRLLGTRQLLLPLLLLLLRRRLTVAIAAAAIAANQLSLAGSCAIAAAGRLLVLPVVLVLHEWEL